MCYFVFSIVLIWFSSSAIIARVASTASSCRVSLLISFWSAFRRALASDMVVTSEVVETCVS